MGKSELLQPTGLVFLAVDPAAAASSIWIWNHRLVVNQQPAAGGKNQEVWAKGMKKNTAVPVGA